MSKIDRLSYMALNKMVTRKYSEWKDPDDYIYASISQPPIKVVNKFHTDDEMEWDVECPNCNKVVNYGEHIFMESGQIYCDSEGCYKKFKMLGKGNYEIKK